MTARMPPSARAIARAVVTQLSGPGAALAPEDVHRAAAAGVSGAATALPHGARIQAAFGHHDVSGVRAHVGGEAADASEIIGARAFAFGDAVAFAAAPDLHLAAHEAAHVVQQRGGVRLAGGVGSAGDAYERHADLVADGVVRGESVEALLDTMAHRGAAGGPAVQRDPPRDPPREATGGAPAAEAASDAIAAGPGGAAAATSLDSVWTLDYHGVHRGVNQAPGARTAASALLVRSLTVAPTEGDTRGRTFRGLHMRDSGPVELGHYRHPANQGGRVSGTVSYVTERALHVAVNGAARGEAAAIIAEVRDGLQDQFVTGDVSAQATAALTDAQRGRGVTVTASIQPGAAAEVEAAPAAYPAISRDGQQLNVLVDIPLGQRDRQTQQRREREGSAAATTGQDRAQTQQVTSTITEAQRAQVTHAVERVLTQRVNQIAVDMTQHIVDHTEVQGWTYEVSGQGNLGVSADVAGRVDSTSIIGRLPRGLGSIVAMLVPELTITVKPNLQLQVGGRVQHTTTSTDQQRDLTEHRQEIQRAVEQAVRDTWTQQLERTVTQSVAVQVTTAATERAGQEQRARELAGSTVTDTVHIPVAAGAPQLSVTTGASAGR
ncbi:MAG: DUF4157 domain-containing protein [Kofleriaceae bacterium]|nr:DUF4157 domain-containing protein [Kofleriaceae bacterium]